MLLQTILSLLLLLRSCVSFQLRDSNRSFFHQGFNSKLSTSYTPRRRSYLSLPGSISHKTNNNFILSATTPPQNENSTDLKDITTKIPPSQPLRPTIVTPEENLAQLLNIPLRFAGFGSLLDGLSKSGLSTKITKGCIVIPRVDIPDLRIVEAQNYEVVDIYLQGYNAQRPIENEGDEVNSSSLVDRVPLDSLDSNRPPGTESYTLYLKLFNSRYNDEPVICTPEEVGLVSLRDEIFEALQFAIPGVIFWTFVSILFWNYGSITSGGGGGADLNMIEMQRSTVQPETISSSYGLPPLL